MNIFRLIPIIIFVLCLMVQTCRAATAYVTDSFEITLRTGPSLQNKVISMPSSGQALKILETRDNWSHVNYSKRGHEIIDGWVLNRYLMNRQPWKLQAINLKTENIKIKERLAIIEKKLKETSNRERDYSKRLQENIISLKKAQNDYTSLKQSSSRYLKLKEDYQTVKASLETLQKTAQTMTRENDILKASQKSKWFATGATVLLVGLIIGLVAGKQQKKKKSLYY
ncbi:MAG: TIGR04211 family SH3 domain-containing protein [Deltaproteobacteria bacterium]|nr:TIGR04211 family SH3 domain-containing protein [Deltaproteobacteria bacterium]